MKIRKPTLYVFVLLTMLIGIGNITSVFGGATYTYAKTYVKSSPMKVNFQHSGLADGFELNDFTITNSRRLSEGTLELNKDATSFRFDFKGIFDPWHSTSRPYFWHTSHYIVQIEVYDRTAGSYVNGFDMFSSVNEWEGVILGDEEDMWNDLCGLVKIKYANYFCWAVKLLQADVVNASAYNDNGQTGYILAINEGMLSSADKMAMHFDAYLDASIFNQNHDFDVYLKFNTGIEGPTGYMYQTYTWTLGIDNTGRPTGGGGGGGGDGDCSGGSRAILLC